MGISPPDFVYRFRVAVDTDFDTFSASQLTGPTYVLDVNDCATVGVITALHEDALGINMMVSLDRLKGHGRRMVQELKDLARGMGKHYLCAENLDPTTEPIWVRLGFDMRQEQQDIVVRCMKI